MRVDYSDGTDCKDKAGTPGSALHAWIGAFGQGCVNSVEDKHAVGTLKDDKGAASGHWEDEAKAAVAEMLGPGTSVPVELSVKCRGLLDKDTFSKSDPMAVLLTADSSSPHSKPWLEVGRTDVVANNLDPDFPRPLRVSYDFERLQPMRLAVYDVDAAATDPADVKLAHSEFLGQADFLLSDLLTAQGQSLRLQLVDEQGRPIPGSLALLSAEELPKSNAVVCISLSASRLDNVETFSKSDPFLRISKMRESGEWVPVLKTEVVPNNLNPAWRPFRASMAQLCNCDPHRPLLLEVFDAEASGAHRLIGTWQGSLEALRAAAEGAQPLPLVNEKKRAAKAGYVSSGSLLVRSLAVQARPSFLDYVRGGCSLNFLVAIDFTASNRDPCDPSSLHHTGSGLSVYERAIQAVGSVLEHYDTDRRFPCYGFGAALPPSGTASHCFPLNGVPGSPEVDGVAGILQAYRATVNSVRLSGPTLFAPIIAEAARVASQPSSLLEYFVLLIITDGCIMDMNNTLQAIVDASQLPLSLLIVGVGDEDFAAMERLDGDDALLRAPNGRQAARDLVQFVPLNKVMAGGAGRGGRAMEQLAAQLLAELPGQVVELFHDIKRTPPPQRASAPPPPAVASARFG